MRRYRSALVATLLSLPLAVVWYYVFNPPQCPPSYTQQQIDASRCVVGANIGGMPLFFAATIITWLLAFWLLRKFSGKQR